MRIRFPFILLLLIAIVVSCQSQKEKATTEEFIISQGYEIEQIAQEPLLESPVAFTEDEKGRIWVVEMTGYMRDIDGNGEDLPDGKIVILSDVDGDDIMDSRTVFAENLLNPRAISLVYGGALYTDGSKLIWSEIVKDKPANSVVVDSLYVVGGNIEHQSNGLFYNIDNWIYSAKSTARYQKKNDRWVKEATSFRGQWGIAADHLGRLVYNHNSAPLQADRTLPNTLLDNPFQKVEENIGNYYTEDMSIQAIQATAVNRGYEDGVLNESGKVKNYTSACSPLMYYGEGLENKDLETAFVCAPEANLISQYEINHLTQNATKRADAGEFLASKDESFRPVALRTGFDNGLYVLDMRKGIIQHSAYMSSYLRDKIIAKNLDRITNKGRIYRIKHRNSTLINRSLHEVNRMNLPYLLYDENLSVRLWAQHELVRNGVNEFALINQLRKIVSDPGSPTAALHAIWTLDGLDLLSISDIKKIDTEVFTAEFAISILPILKKIESISGTEADPFLDELYDLILGLNEYAVDVNLATVFGSKAIYSKEWWELADKYKDDKSMIEALLSSAQDQLDVLLASAKSKGDHKLLRETIQKCIENREKKSMLSPTITTSTADDDRTNGLKVFKQYCVACHGGDGLGQKNIAPSLVESSILKGPEKEVSRIILQGYDQGENEYQIKMPAYIDNPHISDQDISDLISYLNSTFAKKWGGVSPAEVGTVRAEILNNKQRSND